MRFQNGKGRLTPMLNTVLQTAVDTAKQTLGSSRLDFLATLALVDIIMHSKFTMLSASQPSTGLQPFIVPSGDAAELRNQQTDYLLHLAWRRHFHDCCRFGHAKSNVNPAHDMCHAWHTKGGCKKIAPFTRTTRRPPRSLFTSGASQIGPSLQPIEKEVGVATLTFCRGVVKLNISEKSTVI